MTQVRLNAVFIFHNDSWPSWSQTRKASTHTCVRYSAARLVLRKPGRGSCTPLLKILHWLPVKARTENKVSTLCYQCLDSVNILPYLCELLRPYKPSKTLRPQDSSLLVVPRFSLNTFGKKSFSVFGAATWNSLGIHSLYTSDTASACHVGEKNTTKNVSVHKHLS